MALTGTFEDIGFAELLQLLNVSHKSWPSHVWRGTEKADLYILRGDVARAVSRRERGPEVVYRILGWQTGEFAFRAQRRARSMKEIRESTEALILEGMKRFDEWERVESELPDMHVVLRQRAFAVNERFDDLSAPAQTMLRLVDAPRNVSTIIRESGLEPVEAVKAVTELLREGIVEEWSAAAHIGRDGVSGEGRLPAIAGRDRFHAAARTSQATPQPVGDAERAGSGEAGAELRSEPRELTNHETAIETCVREFIHRV